MKRTKVEIHKSTNPGRRYGERGRYPVTVTLPGGTVLKGELLRGPYDVSRPLARVTVPTELTWGGHPETFEATAPDVPSKERRAIHNALKQARYHCPALRGA